MQNLKKNYLSLLETSLNHSCFFLFQDNGKPIWEARMDMETVIGAFEYFGGIAPSIMGETYFLTIDSMHNYSSRNK